ncbi:MAG: hypothetical protein HQ553_00115 [Chloroflexi bacterium]|nr:hypothetical protein [Chloroflexota bacterium]
MNKLKILKTAKHLVSLLVQGDYDELISLSNGIRLQASEMKKALAEYPATFIMPDNIVFEDFDVIEIAESDPPKYSVDIDLWSEEEGRSDLTLQTTMIESEKEIMAVEIDDIHVL